jgi:hypothetical protein
MIIELIISAIIVYFIIKMIQYIIAPESTPISWYKSRYVDGFVSDPPSPDNENNQVGSTNKKSDKTFPNKETSKLHIQILNSSTGPIRVWLDDLPFCPKIVGTDSSVSVGIKKNCGVYTGMDNPDTNKKGNDWTKLFDIFSSDSSIKLDPDLKPRFYLINDNVQTEISENDVKHYFDLSPNQILKITPPHANDEGKFLPQMCFYQKATSSDGAIINSESNIGRHISNDGSSYQFNCGGGGLYFTDVPTDPNMYDNIIVGPDAISRIEYNINGGAIYFNLSGVDGINARYSMDIINGLCEGGGVTSKCNIDLDSCFNETILNVPGLKSSEINNNYLAFTNGNPYIKSCPSPKFYYNNGGLLGRGNITRDNLVSESPIINSCADVINNDSWGNNVNKSIIFSKSAIPSEHQMSDSEVDNIFSITQDQGSSITKEQIRQNAVLLKKTINDNFGPGNFYDKINEAYETLSFTNHTLAECPWGTEKEKALCHLWWGSPNNNCANDWKKYLYDNPDVDTDSWGRYACNQYSWAYGEMGYDYTKRKEDGTSDPSGIIDNTIDGMKGKNGYYLIFFDGNPQKNFPKGYSEGKWIWPNSNQGETNNLESFNKPLLNCPLYSQENPNYLTNNPVYINIDIKQIMDGQYNLSSTQTGICDGLSSVSSCGSVKKRHPNPSGDWTLERMRKPFCSKSDNGTAICESLTSEQRTALDKGLMTADLCPRDCIFHGPETDNLCFTGKGNKECSTNNEFQCFKDNLKNIQGTLEYPFYCSNLS